MQWMLKDFLTHMDLREHDVFLLHDAESAMDRIYEQQSSLNKK